VIADIPGLIAGAARGAGLGHDFLRHIERTSVLIHVLDAAPTNGSTPADNHRAIREELMGYSSMLAEKPEIIALNKLDLIPEPEHDALIADLRADLRLGADDLVFPISGATGIGTTPMLEAAWTLLHADDEEAW